MDRKTRAEQLIAFLRWFVMGLGLAIVGDNIPRASLGGMLLLVAAYNGWLTYCAANPIRFLKHGRKATYIGHALDVALITTAIALTDAASSYTFVLYWFPLVAMAYNSARLKHLTVGGGVILLGNAGATFFAFNHAGNASAMPGMIALRSAIIIFGFLIAVYVGRTHVQNELATERGAYLQAILNCGARLTSFRNVHELALYVLESAVTETGSSGGQLLLVSDETQSLDCEAFYSASVPSQEVSVPPDSLLRSYATWVINSGREFLVRPGGKATEVEAKENGDHPAIAVPLLWHSSNCDSESSTLGVLVVWGFPGEDLRDDVLDILRIFATIAGAAIVNLRLYTNLQKSFLKTLQSLANGLEARDEYTRGHSERVMQVATLVSQELGVAAESVDSLRNASLLHDIGKIGIPDEILRKAGKLTAEEWEQMRRHPIVSEEICRPLGLQPEVLFLIKHHHERLDGKGYPAGLPPQELPLLQRILVVADSFDAMRSRRPYRDRMPREELVGELNRNAGRTLDPTVVDALRHLMDRGDLDIIYAEHDSLIDGIDQPIKQHRQKAA